MSTPLPAPTPGPQVPPSPLQYETTPQPTPATDNGGRVDSMTTTGQLLPETTPASSQDGAVDENPTDVGLIVGLSVGVGGAVLVGVGVVAGLLLA